MFRFGLTASQFWHTTDEFYSHADSNSGYFEKPISKRPCPPKTGAANSCQGIGRSQGFSRCVARRDRCLECSKRRIGYPQSGIRKTNGRSTFDRLEGSGLWPRIPRKEQIAASSSS